MSTTQNDDPASIESATGLHGSAGFHQLVAQSRLAANDEGTPDYQAAANAVKQMRGNAQLRKDEWVSLDDNLVRVAQEELVVVNELRNRGLTVNEDLSTLIREFEDQDEFSAADVDMEPETAASEDSFQFTVNGVPLPIVHKSFHIPYRRLLASRERGQSLDTAGQEAAARAVSERLETLVFDGWGSQVGGYQAYGLTNHPDRNTQAFATDWDASATTSDAIRGDILTAVEGLEADNYRGPYLWFLGRGAYQALRRKDTGTDEERGLLERVREEFNAEFDLIQPADKLATDEFVMFPARSDVVELAVAADMQNVEWTTNAGFRTHMKVMASITPIVKSDASNQSGIFHGTNLLA